MGEHPPMRHPTGREVILDFPVPYLGQTEEEIHEVQALEASPAPLSSLFMSRGEESQPPHEEVPLAGRRSVDPSLLAGRISPREVLRIPGELVLPPGRMEAIVVQNPVMRAQHRAQTAGGNRLLSEWGDWKGSAARREREKRRPSVEDPGAELPDPFVERRMAGLFGEHAMSEAET